MEKTTFSRPILTLLAKEGVRFEKHFVQAPTCGASRYALLTGRYGPAGNQALFDRAGKLAKGQEVPPSMPGWFREHGYTTVSVGKVSHHPGGRGGKDWNDSQKPEIPRRMGSASLASRCLGKLQEVGCTGWRGRVRFAKGRGDDGRLSIFRLERIRFIPTGSCDSGGGEAVEDCWRRKKSRFCSRWEF